MPDYELTQVVQHSILDGRKTAKQIAKEIGKPYSTMLREANPFDTTAKVGIETMLDIMRATGNLSPLQYMASKFGYELVPRRESADERAQAPFSRVTP